MRIFHPCVAWISSDDKSDFTFAKQIFHREAISLARKGKFRCVPALRQGRVRRLFFCVISAQAFSHQAIGKSRKDSRADQGDLRCRGHPRSGVIPRIWMRFYMGGHRRLGSIGCFSSFKYSKLIFGRN